MQKVHLDNKSKFKVLAIITGVLIVVGIPALLPHFLHGHGIHTAIHLVGIIIGSFLTFVSGVTYLEYKTTRLFLIFLAFFSVTSAEILSAANMVFLLWPSYTSVDSIITHVLIVMMLAFFAIGVFRRD